MEKKKILVTGARGFIASNLIKEINKKKYSLYLTSKKLIKSKSYNYINIKNKKDFLKLSKYEFDYVINLHGSISFTNFKEIYNDHYKFNEELIKNLNYRSLKKFIHIGSANEYGSNFHGYDKSNLQEKPNDNYGRVKLMTSNLIKNYCEKKNISYVILRIFHTYGYNQRCPRLFPYLIDTIKNNQIAHINNDNNFKSYVHIDDICKIIKKILIRKMNYNIYNLSISRPVKLSEILFFLEKKFNLKYKVSSNKSNSQYLLRCKITKEIKINYKNFYNELNKIFLSALSKK